MEQRPHVLAGVEGRLPPQIAEKAETDGVAKAGQDAITLVALGVLGGAFIAFGAIFSNIALTGAEGVLPFGLARVVAGLVFGVGLGLVLVGGAQIFTGDVLMVMAWASGRLALRRILRAKARLGLFDHPYTDEARAAVIARAEAEGWGQGGDRRNERGRRVARFGGEHPP